MMQHYWVIGADFETTSFEAARPGSTQLIGPFQTYAEARESWREHAFATKAQATTRYTIVTSAPRPDAR